MFDYSKTKDDDILAMLITKCHIGARNCTDKMKPYVWKKNKDGVHVFHLSKTWEKLMIAARVIAGFSNPNEILLVGSREYAQRPISKCAELIQARTIITKWVSGVLTNQFKQPYAEPRVMIVSDPRIDNSAVREASYMNIPIIGFCDTDSPLENIDIVIPCNTKSKNSIALMYWMLTREILHLRGTLRRDKKWDIIMDLFIYKTPKEIEEEKEKEIMNKKNSEFEYDEIDEVEKEIKEYEEKKDEENKSTEEKIEKHNTEHNDLNDYQGQP